MTQIIRRGAALLLTLALFISLFPAAMAAETEETTSPLVSDEAVLETQGETQSTEPEITEPPTESPPVETVPEETTAPDMEPTVPSETMPEDFPEMDTPMDFPEDMDIFSIGSTQGSIMLFDYADNGNYTTVLNSQVWQQLWLQTGLFYGYFFFPILIAICASYLWRLEHTNHNWNSLMTTPVPRSTIFIAKLVVLAKSILAAQVLLMVFIIIVGKVVFRFEQPIPINMLWWLFMGWFSALSVGAVQLYLSMRIRSFAVPVGLAVCLSIGGLAFHIAGLSEMFPYSQIILGLSSQDEVLPIDSITTLVPMVLVYTVLFVILATNHLKKADVVAG